MDLIKGNHPKIHRIGSKGSVQRTENTTMPVLFSPNFSQEFMLYTDALDIRLGTVLSQDFKGEEHLVLYLSRKLFPREKSYSIIEKESLATKWVVDAFRVGYLLGSSFSLITHHYALSRPWGI